MKHKLLALLLGGLTALLSAGCGGPTSPPPPTPGPSIFPTPPATPTPPTACPSPSACPPARQWKIGIRECGEVAYNGTCLVDTTPFFVDLIHGGVGRCNTEESVCASACGTTRACEPDYNRGPDFIVVSGSANFDGVVRNAENAYQARLKGVRGRVKIRACWYAGVTDQEGIPLDLSGASCGEVTVEPYQ